MADPGAVREELERRLATLEERTRRIEADLRRAGDPDWPDQAIQRENDEVLERLSDAELAEISQLRGALRRLDEGGYGLCQRCGAEIPEPRLQAIPHAEHCMACADPSG